MVSVIIIMVLVQEADVKMDLWLVSACLCHTAAERMALIIQQPDPACRTRSSGTLPLWTGP